MLVGSYGSAIESPQRRVESGHRLHKIVQERSFVPSGAKPALKSQHLISYSKQGGVQHHLGFPSALVELPLLLSRVVLLSEQNQDCC
jgi:hypothetical protein